MIWNTDAIVATGFFTAICCVACSATYAYSRWLGRPRDVPTVSSDMELRLAAIERGLDELAVEVQRVGEAHRFTARLLADKLPAIAQQGLSRGEETGRVVTPH